MKNREKTLNKIRGALYGVAIGDALGGPLEFMSAEKIRAMHGTVTDMIGGGWLNLPPGGTTDDTAMTMAVALGIEENPKDPVPAIGRRFIKWIKSGPRDVGTTCRESIIFAKIMIESGISEKSAWACNAHNNAEGNGALMRTIYPALYYPDAKERSQKVEQIATMTHGGKKSTDICKEYAEIVHAFAFGEEPYPTTVKLSPRAKPTGYVVDTWTHAVQAFCETGTFEEALVEAVNRGGDTDTIGSITGGLAGAWCGYHEIPARWIDALDESLKKEMDRLAELALKNHPEYLE